MLDVEFSGGLLVVASLLACVDGSLDVDVVQCSLADSTRFFCCIEADSW
jgi:hypothetical protein